MIDVLIDEGRHGDRYRTFASNEALEVHFNGKPPPSSPDVVGNHGRRFVLIGEVEEWLKERNIEYELVYVIIGGTLFKNCWKVSFRDEDQVMALLFKLTWGRK